jgi:hypothetical protein
MSHEVEIWVDLVCRGGDRCEPACTLFGRHLFPMRPQVDERISFHQEKGASYRFRLLTPLGTFSPEHSVSVNVDEIRHYAVPNGGDIRYITSLRLSPIDVEAEDDARHVRDFLTSQFGFEVDRYGVDILGSRNASESA